MAEEKIDTISEEAMMGIYARRVGMALCACIVVAVVVMEYYLTKTFWEGADNPFLYAFCVLFFVFSLTSTLAFIAKLITFFR